jgi:hypothetical protein
VAHLRAGALGIAVDPHGDCEYCPGGRAHAEMVRAAEEIRVMSRSDESEL